MTNTKNTKRALLSSVLALFLCFAMLLGTTYAWFTDSVTSENNVIESGNLDIALDYWDGDSWETVEGTNSLFTNNLWEPGHTEVVYLKLSNLGSLALKYQLAISVLSETEGTNMAGDPFKLSDYIQMGVVEGINGENNSYADRATAVEAVKANSGIIGDGYAKQGNMLEGDPELYMAVVVYMPKKVGNVANAKTGTPAPTINLGVQVLATQMTAESDGFDNNQYDEGATFGTYIELEAGADLLAAMASAEADMPLTIKLNGDVEWPTEGHHGENDITPASSIVIDGNGYTITATGSGVTPLGDQTAPMTLKNVKIVDNSVSYNEGAWELTYLEMGGTRLTCENVTFADEIQTGTTATFTNCSFESNEESVYAVWVEDGSATFTGCTFTGYRGLKMHEYYGTEISSVIVKDCTFSDITKKPGIAIGTLNADTTVSITGSTFINCQAGDQGIFMYETDTDVDTINFTENNNIVKVIDLAIATAEELFAFAKDVNENGNTYSGKTVALVADIDLNDQSWTPIGRMINTNGVGENSTFQGNFDGDNHTISNFNVDTVDGVAGNDTNKGAGLFGAVSGTISNLKVTNATIVTAHWAGAIAGVIEGTVEKCSVDNITITCLPEWTGTEWDNGDKAGSIVGYLGSGNVTECTAKNVNITGYRDLGGIVGCSNGTVTNNTVGENVTITYDNDATRNYKNYTSAAQHNIGDYIGRGADENDDGNTGTANYVRGETAGTAEELNTLLAGYVSNSGESITIDITKDFDMANNWTTYNIGNYNGVNSLTINGNGHKITNLNAPLLMGAFAGSGVITINDLTISEANISQNGENLGIGAFIMHSDASGGVVFNKCKLENSVIVCTGANAANGSAYAGGFIGYSSSGNTTFTNCSVTNCQISGQKSAGGLIGHAQTNLTVDGCTVTGNTISETLAGRTSPGAAAIVGRVSGKPITVKNTNVSGNPINQGAAVTSSATSVVCANATYTDGGNNTIQ